MSLHLSKCHIVGNHISRLISGFSRTRVNRTSSGIPCKIWRVRGIRVPCFCFSSPWQEEEYCGPYTENKGTPCKPVSPVKVPPPHSLWIHYIVSKFNWKYYHHHELQQSCKRKKYQVIISSLKVYQHNSPKIEVSMTRKYCNHNMQSGTAGPPMKVLGQGRYQVSGLGHHIAI